jgi:adhesin transport system outer membrane protein
MGIADNSVNKPAKGKKIGFFRYLARCRAHALCLFLGSGAVFSSPPELGPEPKRVVADSLLGVIDEALVNDPQLAIRRSEVAAAGFDLDAAEWERWPTLGLDSKALNDGYQLEARAEQPIWSGGRISSQIEVSGAARDVALAALMETRLDVVLDTSNIFFEILRLREQLHYAVLNEQEHVELLAMIERRVASKISPGSDAVLANSRRQRALTTRIQTQKQLRDAEAALAQALGKAVASNTLREPERIELGDLGFQTLVEHAQDYSPRRKRLLAGVDKAAADVDLARSRNKPSIALGYEHTLADSAGFRRTEDGQVYVSVTVQTGAGLSNRASVSAASSRRDAALAAISDYQLELRQQIESLWAEVAALSSQVEPMQSIVEGSEAMVASYLRQFQVGKKSWLDVLNAQSEKSQSYFLKTDTLMPLLRAKFHLLVLAGEFTSDVQEAAKQ